MDPANILGVFLGGGLASHAAVVFVECMLARQYRHMNGISIKPLGKEMVVESLLGLRLGSGEEIQCRQVVSGVLVWMKVLRVLGLVPIVLYLLATFLAIATPILAEDVQGTAGDALVVLVAVALGIQVIYLVLKLRSRVPLILCSLHEKYQGVPPGKVLLDIFPTWGGRG